MADLPTVAAAEKDTFKIVNVLRRLVERVIKFPSLLVSANPTNVNGTGNVEIVGADGSNALLIMRAYGSGVAAAFRFYRALGTAEVPTALTNNAQIGIFGGLGRGSTADANGNRARIVLLAAEAWTDTAQGTYITFDTTATGGTTVTERVRIANDGAIQMGGANTVISAARHHQLRSYTVAGLPSASTASQMIYVSDETGGAVPAFSDGTNWRRVTDRAVVS